MPRAETAIITGNIMNMGLRIMPVRIITTTMPPTATTITSGRMIWRSGRGVGRGSCGGACRDSSPPGIGGASSFSARVKTTSPMPLLLLHCRRAPGPSEVTPPRKSSDIDNGRRIGTRC